MVNLWKQFTFQLTCVIPSLGILPTKSMFKFHPFKFHLIVKYSLSTWLEVFNFSWNLLLFIHHLSVSQGVGVDSKYFRFCGSYSLCHNYSLQSESNHRQYVNSGHGCVPIKLYLWHDKNQRGQFCLTSCRSGIPTVTGELQHDRTRNPQTPKSVEVATNHRNLAKASMSVLYHLLSQSQGLRIWGKAQIGSRAWLQ